MSRLVCRLISTHLSAPLADWRCEPRQSPLTGLYSRRANVSEPFPLEDMQALQTALRGLARRAGGRDLCPHKTLCDVPTGAFALNQGIFPCLSMIARTVSYLIEKSTATGVNTSALASDSFRPH